MKLIHQHHLRRGNQRRGRGKARHAPVVVRRTGETVQLTATHGPDAAHVIAGGRLFTGAGWCRSDHGAGCVACSAPSLVSGDADGAHNPLPPPTRPVNRLLGIRSPAFARNFTNRHRLAHLGRCVSHRRMPRFVLFMWFQVPDSTFAFQVRGSGPPIASSCSTSRHRPIASSCFRGFVPSWSFGVRRFVGSSVRGFVGSERFTPLCSSSSSRHRAHRVFVLRAFVVWPSWLPAQVITQQSRSRAVANVAGVLHHVEQSPAQPGSAHDSRAANGHASGKLFVPVGDKSIQTRCPSSPRHKK